MTADDPEALVDFRLRVAPGLKVRIAGYARTHPRQDEHGRDRPLSLNAAAVELLEASLRAADLLGAPLRADHAARCADHDHRDGEYSICETPDAPP